MGRKYPTLIPSVFVGATATATVPFPDLDAMWTKLDELRCNRTPAIDVTDTTQNGPSAAVSHTNASVALPPYSVAAPPTSTSQPLRYKTSQHPWIPAPTASTGEVMSTAPVQTPDAFASSFPSWPFAAEIQPDEHQLSTPMDTSDPPFGLVLWIPNSGLNSSAVARTAA